MISKLITTCVIVGLVYVSPIKEFPIEIVDVQLEATAYCHCVQCTGTSYEAPTASGETAKVNHTVAMAKNIPFGTRVLIGEQVYVVEDRGGAITDNRIDIFFNTHQEALEFGRKVVDAKIIYQKGIEK